MVLGEGVLFLMSEVHRPFPRVAAALGHENARTGAGGGGIGLVMQHRLEPSREMRLKECDSRLGTVQEGDDKGDDKADGDKKEEKAGGLAELTLEQLSKYKASTIKTEITTIEEVCPGHPTHSSLNHTL